jgi:hypothetical protein
MRVLRLRFNESNNKYQWLSEDFGWTNVHVSRLRHTIRFTLRPVVFVSYEGE